GIAAIVTGGASGLGAASARMLAGDGAKVTVFDLDETRGAALTDEIGGLYAAGDVTDGAGVQRAVDEACAEHGVARVLVNCAGIAPIGRVVDKTGEPHDLRAFRKAIEVNLIGTFNMLSVFAARLSSAGNLGEERG